MRASDFSGGQFLKAQELTGDSTVTISKVTAEQVGQGNQSEEKLVVWFRNLTKGLVCNKTNLNALIDAYGDDTDRWVGKPVILFSTMVEFQGKRVPGIRVRVGVTGNGPVPVPPRAPTSKDDLQDEIPF